MSECDINIPISCVPISCVLQNSYKVVSFGDLFFCLQINVGECFMLKVNPEDHSLEFKYTLNGEEQEYNASSFKSLIEPLLLKLSNIMKQAQKEDPKVYLMIS